MAWKLKPNENKSSIPKVGTFWMHAADPSSIYLRIDDAVGAALFGDPLEKSALKIYSVNCKGSIVHTGIDAGDFIHLSPDRIEGLRS